MPALRSSSSSVDRSTGLGQPSGGHGRSGSLRRDQRRCWRLAKGRKNGERRPESGIVSPPPAGRLARGTTVAWSQIRAWGDETPSGDDDGRAEREGKGKTWKVEHAVVTPPGAARGHHDHHNEEGVNRSADAGRQCWPWLAVFLGHQEPRERPRTRNTFSVYNFSCAAVRVN